MTLSQNQQHQLRPGSITVDNTESSKQIVFSKFKITKFHCKVHCHDSKLICHPQIGSFDQMIANWQLLTGSQLIKH